MQGSSPLSELLLGLHLTRRLQSLLTRDCDEGIQRGIVAFYSLQAGTSELDGRCGFATKQLRGVLQCQGGQATGICENRLQRQAGGRGGGSSKKISRVSGYTCIGMRRAIL